MGDKVKNIINFFDKNDFDLAKIAKETNASISTVRVQHCKWKKAHGIVKVKKEKPAPAPKKEKVVEAPKIKQPQPTGITEQEFIAYEKVRASGKTNMFDTSTVVRLSGGKLTTDKILTIMGKYDQLQVEYPHVRK